MTCPTIDKLSRYVDDLLVGEELMRIRKHLENCGECREVIEVFNEEGQFIRKILKEPVLPVSFTDEVLAQLEPKMKKRKKFLRRGFGLVAAVVLAVGIGAVINPSFASQIGGLFSTEKVDDGLKIARESGLTEHLNLEATDKGLTFKIEDMIVDTSRIALSHKILNAKGQAVKMNNFVGDARLMTKEGLEIDMGIQSWQPVDDYGLFEFSLPNENLPDQVIIHFNITKINNVKGDWHLEVPVEVGDIRDETIIHSLDAMEEVVDGVKIQMKEIQFAPSSNELFYETGYTDSELEKIVSKVKSIEQRYNFDFKDHFMFGTGIEYHIKNEKDEVIFRSDGALEGEKNRFIHSSGTYLGEIGHLTQVVSFEPSRESERLTLVLDGITKVVASDFSMQVNRSELKERPITFDYEGNSINIKEIEKKVDYSFVKSLLPIRRQKYFTIDLEIEQESGAPEPNTWAIIDEQGRMHEVYRSGSVDKMTLSVYSLDKLPENFTLRLLTKEIFTEVGGNWEVPLYK